MKESCAALGQEYKYHICKEEVSAFTQGEYPALIESARDLGNCSAVLTSWNQRLGSRNRSTSPNIQSNGPIFQVASSQDEPKWSYVRAIEELFRSYVGPS